MIDIKLKRLSPNARMPIKAHTTDAGFDIYSTHTFGLTPGVVIPVYTGITLEIPDGYEGQIRAKSGFAKKGVIIVNAPGTIDAGYRGEIIVLMSVLYGRGCIGKGVQIAQIVIQPVVEARFVDVDELSGSDRGEGGFGSTAVPPVEAEAKDGMVTILEIKNFYWDVVRGRYLGREKVEVAMEVYISRAIKEGRVKGF